MIQTIRRSCCNTLFAACVEPYCYTDEDWTKSVKDYVLNGCKVEMIESGNGFSFEKCTCEENQIKLQLNEQQ